MLHSYEITQRCYLAILPGDATSSLFSMVHCGTRACTTMHLLYHTNCTKIIYSEYGYNIRNAGILMIEIRKNDIITDKPLIWLLGLILFGRQHQYHRNWDKIITFLDIDAQSANKCTAGVSSKLFCLTIIWPLHWKPTLHLLVTDIVNQFVLTCLNQ